MVGAGQLIKLLFGLEYWIAVVIVGILMMIYVLFGGMTATTWVQIIKACLLLAGASFMAFMVMYQYGFSPEAMFADAIKVKNEAGLDGTSIMAWKFCKRSNFYNFFWDGIDVWNSRTSAYSYALFYSS